jgi:hypothetical protein
MVGRNFFTIGTVFVLACAFFMVGFTVGCAAPLCSSGMLWPVCWWKIGVELFAGSFKVTMFRSDSFCPRETPMLPILALSEFFELILLQSVGFFGRGKVNFDCDEE